MGIPVLLLFVHSAYALLSSTGSTVQLDKIHYFVPPAPITTIDLQGVNIKHAGSTGLVPMTVVQEGADVSTTASQFQQQDDVFQPGFLDGRHKSLDIWVHLLRLQETVIRRQLLSLAILSELPHAVIWCLPGSARAAVPRDVH